MATEIERKFLVEDVPGWLERCESDPIDQGYLAVVEGEREVRLRRRGEQLALTVKVGAGEMREETEVELTPEQFAALWPLTEGARLSKRRYRVPADELTIEVDVYGKELEGMIVAEIEFESAQDSQAFDPPEWMGTEVTGEAGYANESLALHGPPGSR